MSEEQISQLQASLDEHRKAVDALTAQLKAREVTIDSLHRRLYEETDKVNAIKNGIILDKLTNIKSTMFLLKYVGSEPATHRQKKYHVERALDMLKHEHDEIIYTNKLLAATFHDLPF